jgi:hypothetical protein
MGGGDRAGTKPISIAAYTGLRDADYHVLFRTSPRVVGAQDGKL